MKIVQYLKAITWSLRLVQARRIRESVWLPGLGRVEDTGF